MFPPPLKQKRKKKQLSVSGVRDTPPPLLLHKSFFSFTRTAEQYSARSPFQIDSQYEFLLGH